MSKKASAEATVSNIRRKTRRKYSAEEKIRIVLEGLRGDHTVAELCRREGISEALCGVPSIAGINDTSMKGTMDWRISSPGPGSSGTGSRTWCVARW